MIVHFLEPLFTYLGTQISDKLVSNNYNKLTKNLQKIILTRIKCVIRASQNIITLVKYFNVLLTAERKLCLKIIIQSSVMYFRFKSYNFPVTVRMYMFAFACAQTLHIFFCLQIYLIFRYTHAHSIIVYLFFQLNTNTSILR